MDNELLEELDFLKETLIKSGFFDENEILEIIEEQFIDEEGIEFDKLDIVLSNPPNSNFSRLEDVFINLSKKGIIAIHHCGYNIEEGVNDAFELLVHIQNHNKDAIGFCFYTFEDIEEAIYENKLKLTFGDFENDKSKALEIGMLIKEVLEDFSFNVSWDGTIDNQIEINPFVWDKKYDSNKEYEMEGAFELFINNQV